MTIRKFVLSWLLLGVTLMLSTGAVWAQAEVMPQAIAGKTVPCPMPLPPSEIEGETIVCGEITVPEDWDNPASKPITITYAVQRSTSKSPFADPILYFVGGPGASVLGSIGSHNYDFSYFRERRDVILFDQRGVGFSSELRCPEEVANPDPAALAAARDAYPAFTLTAESDPVEAVNYYFEHPGDDYLANCAAYFQEQGRDLKTYTTLSTVQDAIALMNHLGYPEYNLFGISYGSNVVLDTLDFYKKSTLPDLPVVRTAFIDGVFPPNVPQGVLDNSFNTGLAFLRLMEACEADPACAGDYPNIRQRAIDLLAQLEAAPLTLETGEQITVADLSNLLTAAIFLRNHDIIALLPRMFAELESGDAGTYRVATGLLDGSVTLEQSAAAATPFDPLTGEIGAVAGQLRTLADRLDRVGAESRELERALLNAKTLPELYMLLLNDGLKRVAPDERDVFATGIGLYRADATERTRQGLINLSGSLPEPTVAAELVSIVNAMSEAEVAQMFVTLTDPDFVQPLMFYSNYFSQAVICNDRIAYTSVSAYQELLRGFEVPQLIGGTDNVPRAIAECRLFGLGEAAGTADVPPGVVSDIPTLVFNGALDLQTPAEWGELAFETLANAQMVMFPGAGHGATRYSACARDIAVAFVTYPEAEFDQSCVKDLRRVFALPTDALPEVPAAMPE